jgi:hypothetical protein
MLYRSLGIGLLCLSACAHQKNAYELKRDAQHAQLRRSAPAALGEDEGGEWRAFKTLKARFYYDPAFAKLEGNVETHVKDRLPAVNDVLEAAIHARVVIESVRALPENIPSQIDLDVALKKLEAQDLGEDVELVVGLIGARPVASFSFFEVGRARVLGKHVVLRSMSSPEEIRALDTFDAVDPETRSRLYQQRKRHKEAAMMLHEIAHSLCALHVRITSDLMHPSYDPTMQTFTPRNVELMKLALDERLRSVEDQDLRALATALKLRLTAAPWEGFLDKDRDELLAMLESMSSAPTHQTTAMASRGSAPRHDTSARDLSALAAADRARLGELDDKSAAGDTKTFYEGVRQLADAHPHIHFLQHEACETGMKLKRSFKEIAPYCDRVAAVAAP